MTKRASDKYPGFVRPGCREEKRLLTAAHLISDFLYLQDKLGRRPRISDYLCHCHTPKVLDRVFGKPGWRRMVGKIGKKVMPKRYLLDTEHLIRDYLDTEQTIGRKPSYADFHARHRHSPNVLYRVFGKSGWSNLRKAAAVAKREKTVLAEEQYEHRGGVRTARTEKEILKDIRAVYRGLSRAIRTASEKKISEKARKRAWKLRSRLHDLFHEAGRAISVEEAFQKKTNK